MLFLRIQTKQTRCIEKLKYCSSYGSCFFEVLFSQFHCSFFDSLSLFYYFCIPTNINISQDHIIELFVVQLIIILLHILCYLSFQLIRWILVDQQHYLFYWPVLEFSFAPNYPDDIVVQECVNESIVNCTSLKPFVVQYLLQFVLTLLN